MRAGNRDYDAPAALPDIIPVFPLDGVLLLPGSQMPFNIFEPRYLAMVEDALAADRVIGMVQPLAGGDAAAPPLHEIGCAGRIVSWAESGDGRYLITLSGISRFRAVEELPGVRGYRRLRIDVAPFAADLEDGRGADEVDRPGLLRTFRAFLEANDLKVDWENIDRTPTGALVNALAMMSPYGRAEKQALLEAPDFRARAETLVALTEASLARGPSGRSQLN